MIRPLRLALCLLWAAPLPLAQAQTITWEMANEYPATSIHGEGDQHFAKLVLQKSHGKIVINHDFDASHGLRSKDMLEAVASGKLPLADIYSGAMGDAEPIFLLSSLPFLATTTDQSRALFETAEAAYDQALARHNQKLLYPSPWPPTGIWAKQAITSRDSLKGLRIRTYDRNGTLTFEALGAKPVELSFADALPLLAKGDIQAVLSSGDGGAGAKLWEYVDHFTAINYAMPLSLVTINLDVWKALPPALKRAVRDAANATEARQWLAIRQRLDENYVRMRTNHVVVTPRVPADFTAALKQAGRTAIDAWVARYGAEGRLLLADYDRRTR